MARAEPDAAYGELEERLRTLAGEKATLQLVLRLIERLNPLSSIDELLDEFLTSIVDTIGGTSIALFYWDEGALHRVGLSGENEIIPEVDQPLAREVVAARAFVERLTDIREAQLKGSALQEACSWGFPLLVADELIGVVVVENLHISSRALGRHLPVFFDHAALILCNELRRRSRDRAERALRESDERLRQLGDNLPAGMVYELEMPADGSARRFVHVSGGVAKLHEISVDAVQHDPMRLYSQVVEPDPAALAALETQSLASMSPFTAEVRFRLPSGAERWAWLNSAPRRMPDGHVLFDGIELDITERKRAEAEQARLQSMLVQAQKMEAVGQLAGGVAHDFNNILTAILMNLDVLREEELSPHGEEVVGELEQEANRAVSLTRQLLLFSRREVMQVRPIELSSLIGNLLKMLGRLIGENIALELRGASADLWIEADPGMIEQVILNLVVNARDAMPEGGRICLHTQLVELDAVAAAQRPEGRAGRFVALEVSDTGTGMDDETAKRVFEPFFTTKSAGRGTGLGLATAYGIVHQHHGWIELETQLGQGTTFRVVLPLRPRATERVEHSVAGEPVVGGSERLLVVEDDPSLRRVFAATLTQLGYCVTAASNGAEALETWSAAEGGFDLVLSDMVMPGAMTGLQLVAQILRQKPSLKVILMSGYSPDLSESELLHRPGVTFLPKPIPMRSLARSVRKALDG